MKTPFPSIPNTNGLDPEESLHDIDDDEFRVDLSQSSALREAAQMLQPRSHQPIPSCSPPQRHVYRVLPYLALKNCARVIHYLRCHFPQECLPTHLLMYPGGGSALEWAYDGYVVARIDFSSYECDEHGVFIHDCVTKLCRACKPESPREWNDRYATLRRALENLDSWFGPHEVRNISRNLSNSRTAVL